MVMSSCLEILVLAVGTVIEALWDNLLVVFVTSTIMEVDDTVSSTPLTLKSPASDEKRPKLDLPQDQLTAIYHRLNEYRSYWLANLRQADSDASRPLLISTIFLQTVSLLAATDKKNSFIQPQQVEKIVSSFNKDEVNEWIGAIRKGIEEGDWETIVSHRTLHSTLIPSSR
jgi:hypothetical protein